MAPLTAAQLVEHPEFPNVIWDLKPTQAGIIQVADGRGGPFGISYEVHGTGDICLVWIMGLGGFKTAWQRQTRHFCHSSPENARTYRSLVFDNRGMGASAKPSLRYSTSEMARDTLDLVNALGWTSPRQLHVIGVSMGGMIAQELGLLIPDRIASLILVSTAARVENTVGYIENLRQRINLFIPKEINSQLAEVKANLFSQAFLDAPDKDGGFPTNGDRFAANELRKRMDKVGFTRKGFVLQAVAAGWHHKSPEQLKMLADRVGRQRICVMHGTLDRMLTFHHALVLVRELGHGVRFERYQDKGHVLGWEVEDAYNRVIEEMVHNGSRSDPIPTSDTTSASP